jgi:predicted metal-dependent enzyme (double-stranded beta helix superfamily)
MQGMAGHLHGSEGSQQYQHQKEFMSQPHLGPAMNQPAPVNLSLASVSSAAGSQKYLAQAIQSHKRTSSVTNSSSQRTGSLVGGTSGRRGSQPDKQNDTPHA